MTLKKIRVAVVGCGRWGPYHLRHLSNPPDSEVACAVDSDPAPLRAVARHFPDLPLLADHRQALADPSVDAVVVATPTSSHFRLAREALLADKHVLCEKPLCETAAEAEELVALAASRQRVLMVGHVFLFNGGVLKLKELVDKGQLGRLHYLSAVRTNLGPIRSDVNAAYDLATHDIAIFNWLLGGLPQVVSATGADFVQPGIEDVAFVTLRYPVGVLALIQASWLNPRKVRQITAVGSARMVTWDDLELNTPVAVYERGNGGQPALAAREEYGDYGEFLRASVRDGDVRLPKVDLEEPLKTQAREFLRRIRGVSRDPQRSDGAFGLGVVRTLEAVSQSMRNHGAPVTLDR